MPARNVFEIYRRSAGSRVSLGLVTDDFIAKQVIDSLYQQMKQSARTPEGQISLAEHGFEAYDVQGAAQDFDTWSTNNKNSPTPVFFFVKKTLWNAVPSEISNWLMVETGDQFSQFPGDTPSVLVAMEPQVE